MSVIPEAIPPHVAAILEAQFAERHPEGVMERVERIDLEQAMVLLQHEIRRVSGGATSGEEDPDWDPPAVARRLEEASARAAAKLGVDLGEDWAFDVTLDTGEHSLFLFSAVR